MCESEEDLAKKKTTKKKTPGKKAVKRFTKSAEQGNAWGSTILDSVIKKAGTSGSTLGRKYHRRGF